jgi:hypothetical protein
MPGATHSTSHLAEMIQGRLSGWDQAPEKDCDSELWSPYPRS